MLDKMLKAVSDSIIEALPDACDHKDRAAAVHKALLDIKQDLADMPDATACPRAFSEWAATFMGDA